MSSRFEKLFDLSIGLLATASPAGVFQDVNAAWPKLLGWSKEEMTSRPFIDFVHPDDRESTLFEAAKLFTGEPTIHFENRYRCKDGSYRWLVWSAEVDMAPDPEKRLMYAAAQDITPHKEEQHRREAALMEAHQLQERLRAALEAMATPLIPITDRVVVMPLVGQMDSDRAQRVMAAALEGVQSRQAGTVILDVTGLAEIDSQVASAVVSTAQALRLLGARTMLTGIRPAVAQMLVGLGANLQGITTYATLQSAILAALGAPPSPRGAPGGLHGSGGASSSH
jgi:rsbT co-antagonist protein RsbR